MIHGRTKQEVHRYDFFKAIITGLLLLLLFLVPRDQLPVDGVELPGTDVVAEVPLTAPQLLSPAPGAEVQPGIVSFSGMGVPLSTAAILVDGVPAAQAIVAENGSWQMEADLAAGQRSIELQTLDEGGNVAAAAPAFTLNVGAPDVTEPEVEPVELAPDAAALEVSVPDAAIAPGIITLNGRGQPGLDVAISIDGTDAGTTTVGEDGVWSIELPLAAGAYAIAARQLTADGAEVGPAQEIALEVAELAPASVNLPAIDVRSGSFNLTGTGAPGTRVLLFAGATALGEALVGDDGTWELPVDLDPGDYEIDIATLDPEGNELMRMPAISLPVLPNEDEATVGGTLTYLQRVALPPDAVITMQIQDISLADAPALVVGEQVIDTEGEQVPFDFAVPYDPAEIVESNTYSLGARIEDAAGNLLFINDTITPVITNGSPTEGIEVVVVPVDGAAATAGENTVSGTITYLEPVALPPDATITVQIQDISRADAEAVVIGEQIIPAGEASAPFEFAVPYDPADIVESNTYGLRVRVEDADGDLLFTSDTVTPVITGDNLTEGIEVVTTQVAGAAAAPEEATVTGTVTYLERIALPPDATITVAIQDTSLADAPAVTIGDQIIPSDGNQVPFDYAVPYDPADIEENRTYTMRARIEDGNGNLLFINDTAVPVITRGSPTEDVEIITVPVEAQDAGEEGAETAVVTGTVSYPQRIALPPDAIVEVSLQNISTPGAAATELGSQTIPTEGAQVPIPFEISYNPADIIETNTYGLRARIVDGEGNLIWTSDTVTPVITRGNPKEDVSVEVIAVQASVLPEVEFDPDAETAVEAVETAPAVTSFNTLLSGLDAAGLTEVLSDADASFTLFAPTDAAFDALPPEVIAAWDANPARYAEMMSYLVVEGAYAPEDLEDGQVLRTIAGTNIGINKDGDTIEIGGVPTAGHVVAGNSVVYALNEVILAPLRPGITPPVIDEEGVPVFKGPLLTVVGDAEPGTQILLQVDGENFGEIATVDETGFWLVAENIDSGVHQILAYMLAPDGTLMAISQLVILPVP